MPAIPAVRSAVDHTVDPPRARVRLTGEFDLAMREHLDHVLTVLRFRGCTTIQVDAQDVSFVDASCLRVLHTQAHLLREAGGVLRLVAASAVFIRTVEAAGYRALVPGGPDPGEPPRLPRPRGRATAVPPPQQPPPA